MDSLRKAVVGCPIIVTISNATTPVFDRTDLKPGTHVVATGSRAFQHRKVDDTTVQRSKIVLECMDQAMREAGGHGYLHQQRGR